MALLVRGTGGLLLGILVSTQVTGAISNMDLQHQQGMRTKMVGRMQCCSHSSKVVYTAAACIRDCSTEAAKGRLSGRVAAACHMPQQLALIMAVVLQQCLRTRGQALLLLQMVLTALSCLSLT